MRHPVFARLFDRMLSPAMEREMAPWRSASRFRRQASMRPSLDGSRIWPLLAGECHCARDTVAMIESACFRVDRRRSLHLGPDWLNTNPCVLGLATLA